MAVIDKLFVLDCVESVNSVMGLSTTAYEMIFLKSTLGNFSQGRNLA